MSSDEGGPRSGVVGLTPLQLRYALLRNGWDVVPIVRHDVADKSAGKRPVIRGWEQFAQYDAPLPSCEHLRKWDRKALEQPGTGIPCGDVVAIDIDFASDPDLAHEMQRMAVETFGSTPFVRQGQAPKLALVYRAAEAIETQAFKVHDGSGDGLDILAIGRQLVAFGIHPKTLRPYAWIGSESPLTASPDETPPISRAQITTFLESARTRVDLSKIGGRKRGGTGGGRRG
jgi:Bifunctional DNA primase/polymerase, N-terminal